MHQGEEMVKKAIAVVVIVVLHLVAACAPRAPTPTPTPEPTPTPVWVLASKPEHLAGLWHSVGGLEPSRQCYRFETDGIIRWESSEGLKEPSEVRGRFWFEDGVYYQECDTCFAIGSYRAYLEIEEGRAVGLRFEEIDDSDPSCFERRNRMTQKYHRVDS
jgi:hypothetical protein